MLRIKHYKSGQQQLCYIQCQSLTYVKPVASFPLLSCILIILPGYNPEGWFSHDATHI